MELIDADTLLDRFEDIDERTGRTPWTMNDILDLVNTQPTVDAVPVVHGEWTVVELNDWGDEVIYECPICKEAFQIIEGTPEENNYNYCPNCGALMDGGE